MSRLQQPYVSRTTLRIHRPISISEGLESMGEKMGVASGPTIKVAYLLEDQGSCVTYYPCEALTYLGQTQRGV